MTFSNAATQCHFKNATTQCHYPTALPNATTKMQLHDVTTKCYIWQLNVLCPTVFIIPSQLLGVTTVTAVCLLFLMMSAHVISAPSILYEQDDVIDSKPEADMTDFQIATFVTATETPVKHIL